MPANHRFRSDISPGVIRVQAARIGPNVETFVDVLMRNRRHPEQAYRACLGVLKLARSYGKERLDTACERALTINAHSYSSLNSILKIEGVRPPPVQGQARTLDRVPRTRPSPSRQILQGKIACRVIDEPAITHPNIPRTKGAPDTCGPPLAGRADDFH